MNSEDFCYWYGFSDITVPTLSFSGAGDKNDPSNGCKYLYEQLGSWDKTYINLGKTGGYSKDFDHVGMVISKEAQKEVWSLVTK